ncbi:MAG: hypothetical protein B7X95_01180 [Methylophilaceae bacterium 17-44-8]|jgi:hypothetical protein|nr:MAG: hypothetical protein B7Y48_02480 [Methylophilales bacterium 28-44-11]OYZ07013.1 MAG: hypothetical protein B7Y32_03045 [Methylophilales bacterium 16-45-7]OZA06810.1 MAG: hypothetical protein B7X95_01180 [Methylophilaceae bacterium 17-44-8]
MKTLSTLFCSVLITACAHHPTSFSPGKPMPERAERSSATQFMKTDFDRMADVELAENTLSLKTLMLKLYKRNPQELAKSTSDPAEKMVTWVFEGELQHHWQFADMQNKQGTEAIHLSFHPDYQGDRVLAFIVGIQTMLQKAHSDKKEFFLTDSIDPQSVYNVARNVEIAAWKLSNSRKPNGELYLLSNELNAQARNLTFEREFGKIIGRTDLFAFMLAEKSERLISRITQNIATMAFLPF